MTTASAQIAPPTDEGAGVSAPRARLATTIGAHSVVDAFSFTVIPLMPLLREHLDLTLTQGAVVLAAGGISSGLIQPLVAWLGDKHDTRIIGTLGFLVAVLAIGSIGHAHTYAQLLMIQIVGTAGVGAFHPTAAAIVGQLSGSRRSLGLATFFLFGMLGGIAGNIGWPYFVSHFAGNGATPDVDLGLRSIGWLIPPALLAVAAVAWATHRAPHRAHNAHDSHASLPSSERLVRWTAVGVLYVTNCIRFTVNMALVQLFIAWAERLTLARAGTIEMTDALSVRASEINGPIQAAMQLGMGFFALAAGFLIRTKHEKLSLVLIPLLGSLAVVAFPYADDAPAMAVTLAVVLGVLCGIGFGGVIPLTIALAQRLLPHRTGLASGLMLGGAWAMAATGPLLGKAFHDWLGLDRAFVAVALLLAMAGLIALAIPNKLIHAVADR